MHLFSYFSIMDKYGRNAVFFNNVLQHRSCILTFNIATKQHSLNKKNCQRTFLLIYFTLKSSRTVWLEIPNTKFFKIALHFEIICDTNVTLFSAITHRIHEFMKLSISCNCALQSIVSFRSLLCSYLQQ